MGFHRDLYEATGNPWYVWEHYRLSRQEGQAPAEWVLRYFDESARRLRDLGVSLSQKASKLPEGAQGKVRREKLSRKTASRLANALGFNQPGRGNFLLDANLSGTSERQYALALQVHQVKRQLGTRGASKAILIVATTHNQPVSTVGDAWKKFGRVKLEFTKLEGERPIIVLLRKKEDEPPGRRLKK
jgi:hypothetical protein